MADREFDVVVWGATGFTGKWVARHLFEHYPQTKLRWAIAGRNPQKLDDVRDFIGDTDGQVQGLIADSNDEDLLRELVKSTKVIISTVGPYAYYGSLLVRLCAECGTHYTDLTGEVPWMRQMIDQYAKTAEQTGARIVHTCGFDSIPSDMGNYFMQQTALREYGKPLKFVRYSLLKSKGGVSGGTVHSMLNIMKLARSDKNTRRLLANPYSLNPDPGFRGPDQRDQMGAQKSPHMDRWTAPFVMSAINTRVVRRSNALLGFPWGEDFSYTECMTTGSGLKGRLAASGISVALAGFAMTAMTGPGRKLWSMILPDQGEGPKVDPNDPGFYVIDLYGETAAGDSLQYRLHGDGDPGYGSTSKMLAESAVCLALDEADIRAGGGFWTPASAMGDPLLKRLQDLGGLQFKPVISD